MNVTFRCIGWISMMLGVLMAREAIAADTASTRPATVRVACVQCASDLGDVAGNRAKLTRLIEEAAEHGAKIIVLPECAITGYLSQDLRTTWHRPGWPIDPNFSGKDPSGFAETVPGASTDQFCALAKRLGVYVTIPLVEIEPNPPAQARYFNTVCLAAPDGKLVAHYRKLNPWLYPEQSWATKGDLGVATYDTKYGRVGLAICFDIHTVLEKYQPEKIWALLYPIAWVEQEHPADWFWRRLPQRVGKFGHYVIGANWSVDKPQPWRGYGFSTIIAPSGEVVASAKSLYGPEIVYAEIKTASATR
jgi:predicted amidohydrolase